MLKGQGGARKMIAIFQIMMHNFTTQIAKYNTKLAPIRLPYCYSLMDNSSDRLYDVHTYFWVLK